MDSIAVNRAQYDVRKHRDGYSKSSKYDYTITLDFENDEPTLEVTITRKSDGKLLLEQPVQSYDEAEEVISEWRAQLNIESTDTNMW